LSAVEVIWTRLVGDWKENFFQIRGKISFSNKNHVELQVHSL